MDFGHDCKPIKVRGNIVIYTCMMLRKHMRIIQKSSTFYFAQLSLNSFFFSSFTACMHTTIENC